MSDYRDALEQAGAEVLCFEHFGSYQGDWWAKVTYNSETFWVTGSYGSCSGCDAFQSEFGYSSDQGCEGHEYNPDKDCPDCRESHQFYLDKVAEFGKPYLNDPLSQAEAEKKASENLEWDSDAPEMLKFIQDNRI